MLYCKLAEILKAQNKKQIHLVNDLGMRPQTVNDLYHNKYKAVVISMMDMLCR
ncbi:DNA-binding Xre family transcriptional regulator [Lachnospiraceae bacterium PF1-22]